MRISKISLEEGMEIPRFYGFSHMEIHTSMVVYYIIPFNLIVRTWRLIWIKIKNPTQTFFERELRREFIRGYRLGVEQAKETILKDMMSFIKGEHGKETVTR